MASMALGVFPDVLALLSASGQCVHHCRRPPLDHVSWRWFSAPLCPASRHRSHLCQPQRPDACLACFLTKQTGPHLTPLTHHAPLGLPQEERAPLACPWCWPCYHHRWSWRPAALHDHDRPHPCLHLLLLLSLHLLLHLIDHPLPLGFLPSTCCLRLSHHLCSALLLNSLGFFHALSLLLCLPCFFCFSRLCQNPC